MTKQEKYEQDIEKFNTWTMKQREKPLPANIQKIKDRIDAHERELYEAEDELFAKVLANLEPWQRGRLFMQCLNAGFLVKQEKQSGE